MTESTLTKRRFSAREFFSDDDGGQAESVATMPYPQHMAKNFEPGTEAAARRARKICDRGGPVMIPPGERLVRTDHSHACRRCVNFIRLGGGCPGVAGTDPTGPMCLDDGRQEQ